MRTDDAAKLLILWGWSQASTVATGNWANTFRALDSCPKDRARSATTPLTLHWLAHTTQHLEVDFCKYLWGGNWMLQRILLGLDRVTSVVRSMEFWNFCWSSHCQVNSSGGWFYFLMENLQFQFFIFYNKFWFPFWLHTWNKWQLVNCWLLVELVVFILVAKLHQPRAHTLA
jgi:hypothetical protein